MSKEKSFPYREVQVWMFSDMENMLKRIMYREVKFSDELTVLPVVYATVSHEILEILYELDSELPDSVLTKLDKIYYILDSYGLQSEEEYKVLDQKDSYRLLDTLRALKDTILSDIVKPALKKAYTS